MNEKVTIEILRRKIPVELDGLTELEVVAIAKDVSEKMEQIQTSQKIPDSSKVAILAALEFAADLARIKEAHQNAKRAAETAILRITQTIKTALPADEK